MIQKIYCIYKANNELPYKVLAMAPLDSELTEQDIVCEMSIDNDTSKRKYEKDFDPAVSLVYDEEKVWYSKGSLFLIYELENDYQKTLIGSDEGYAYKKARSIVKNLLIAYPKKKFKIVKKLMPEKDVQD